MNKETGVIVTFFFCCQWRQLHRKQGVKGVVAVAQRTRNVFWHVSCLLFYSFLYKSINKLTSGIKPAPPLPWRVGEEQLLLDIVTTILLLSNSEVLSAWSSKTLAVTTINRSCTLTDIIQLIEKPAGWMKEHCGCFEGGPRTPAPPSEAPLLIKPSLSGFT